jgi:putative YhdH/YhfP family quinone oxidoreductase
MDPESEYQALVADVTPSGVERQIRNLRIADLPPGDVLVRVQFSSLNYKDALSASGNRGVTRNYPHTPGIDAAGIIVESSNPEFKPGQEVVVMDYDLGANSPGGYGQYIRVPAGWAMPAPQNMDLEDVMAYGTAGLTAALSIYKLEKAGITPQGGQILVTGATGGVGIFAVGMLALSGYRVVAVTGKQDKAPLLRSLGAEKVIPREEASDESGRPLLHATWAGVIDTVGGNYLATALKATLPGGAVTTCGNVAGAELKTTVFPFILRGVSLLGIDVSQLPMALRQELWGRITGPWRIKELGRLYHTVSLQNLESEIERILKGQQAGRVVVRLG